MATQYSVTVAHFGHPNLKVKHWAIVVMLNTKDALAYQITGSSATYELKPIESITIENSFSYLGKVIVGSVDKNRLPQFGMVIAGGEIVHGDLNWNCQNWVVERLQDLRAEGYPIQYVDQTWLLEQLANNQK